MLLLKHGDTKATINELGAWVETLSLKGQDILFPKTILTSPSGEDKTRGGMHVCLPNFGPAGESGLPQHGFGRQSVWKVVKSEDSRVELVLKSHSSGYEGLSARLVYQLDESALSAKLELDNQGVGILRLAPAFHPYFAVGDNTPSVKINDRVYRLDSLAGTEFIEAKTMSIQLGDKSIRLSQENLPVWAIWTDLLGPYVCIEPTFGGYRFLELEHADEVLEPKETRKYSIIINWRN